MTTSVSPHLGFIYLWDKHKYSHIILPKTSRYITHLLLSEISWIISCLLWQDKRDSLFEITFLPADYKDLYVTTEHLLNIEERGEETRGEKREDWDQTNNRCAPVFSECFISYENVVLNMCHWHCGSGAELWKTDLNVSRYFQTKHE